MASDAEASDAAPGNVHNKILKSYINTSGKKAIFGFISAYLSHSLHTYTRPPPPPPPLCYLDPTHHHHHHYYYYHLDMAAVPDNDVDSLPEIPANKRARLMELIVDDQGKPTFVRIEGESDDDLFDRYRLYVRLICRRMFEGRGDEDEDVVTLTPDDTPAGQALLVRLMSHEMRVLEEEDPEKYQRNVGI